MTPSVKKHSVGFSFSTTELVVGHLPLLGVTSPNQPIWYIPIYIPISSYFSKNDLRLNFDDVTGGWYDWKYLAKVEEVFCFQIRIGQTSFDVLVYIFTTFAKLDTCGQRGLPLFDLCVGQGSDLTLPTMGNSGEYFNQLNEWFWFHLTILK